MASADVRRASLPAGVDSRRISQETLAVAPKEQVQNEAVIKSEEDREGPGELSIPIEHTTAAHKLLRWPSIRKLVDPITQNEHYVMQGEEKRGILRVWGRGEGVDAPTGAPVGLDQGEDDFTRGASLYPPPDALWSTGLSRSGGAVDTRRPAIENPGGLNPDGSLKLDHATLFRLLKSYQDNMHIMHPFLDQDQITQMISDFGERYQSPASGQPRSPFVVSSSMNSNEIRRESVASLGHGTKRKRSSANLPGNSPAASYSGTSGVRGPPQKSIGSALVLLVAALGKICEHKDFLLAPVPSDTPSEVERVGLLTDSSSPFRTDSPPISVKHSPASSHSSALASGASPQDTSRSYPIRRSSIDAGSPVDRTPSLNVDVIPGLAYYAYATEILGTLLGGNELAHVQAGILAGLYAGQLGRVLESWKWINWACTTCQVLVTR